MIYNKGYRPYTLNCKTMKYEEGYKEYSTMSNLDNRYVHHSDTKLLDKIEQGLSVMDGITFEDQKNVIIWGLHEYGYPPGLIHPRPNIMTTGAVTDKHMSRVMKENTAEYVFKAMYDRSIVFEFESE